MQCGAYACARVCVGVFVLLQIYLVYLNKRYRNVNWRAHQTMNKNSNNNNKNNNHNRCICWQRRVQRCCRKSLLGVMLEGLQKKKHKHQQHLQTSTASAEAAVAAAAAAVEIDFDVVFGDATRHDATRRIPNRTKAAHLSIN